MKMINTENKKEGNKDNEWRHEQTWEYLHSLVWLTFFISGFLYSVVLCKDPGYAKQIELNKFYVYLDLAMKEDRNLDYFCFFCRTIWSSTGVHCMNCGKCVEGFDHHC